MKINDLITKLQKILKEQGNLTVVIIYADFNNIPTCKEIKVVDVVRNPINLENVVDIG